LTIFVTYEALQFLHFGVEELFSSVFPLLFHLRLFLKEAFSCAVIFSHPPFRFLFASFAALFGTCNWDLLRLLFSPEVEKSAQGAEREEKFRRKYDRHAACGAYSWG
jgi:hypothetical protein